MLREKNIDMVCREQDCAKPPIHHCTQLTSHATEINAAEKRDPVPTIM